MMTLLPLLTLLQFGGGKGISHYIQKGGWVMWPLTGLLFLGVLIIAERMWTIIRAKTKTNEFMHVVRSQIIEGQDEDAKQSCEEYPGSISRVVKTALLRREQGLHREELEKVLENAAIKEIAHLERGLWLLALISNVAPILGFLGTVVGMINSFDVLAKEGMNNPGAVAAGISTALITTAGGLIVAVVVLPFYNWFTARIGSFINELESVGNFLLESFEEADQGKTESKKATA